MHNLAAEKNIFRLPASAALTHARPQPLLHRRLPPNPSPQIVTSSAFIKVLAGPRVDTPTRDHTVHRTPKNSAFLNVLAVSRLDTGISNLNPGSFVTRTL